VSEDKDVIVPRKLAWDTQKLGGIDWMNTHLDGLDERDTHHVGRTSNATDGDLVVLRLGSDDDAEPHHTILLTSDQANDLAAMLRMAAS
jgi:hypothetical protein